MLIRQRAAPVPLARWKARCRLLGMARINAVTPPRRAATQTPTTSRRVTVASPFGQLLRQWRDRRRLSQLALALDAEVSARHLSFIETGRAQPSREMVLLLARVLEVPPRARNELLTAAGYAPMYRESGLEAPEMSQVRRALDFMLRQQEPFPALVVDGRWNILASNQAAGRLIGLFLDEAAAAAVGPPNAMRLTYHPQGLRPFVVNWPATAAALIQWLHRRLLAGVVDGDARRLLDELLAYPDVPSHWRTLDVDAPTAPFLAVELAKGDVHVKFFSTLTTLGVPYDITLQELRVECFFPADEPSEALMRRLAESPAPRDDRG